MVQEFSGFLYSLPHSKEQAIFTVISFVKRYGMPKVSSKRQITLPASQCDQLGIKPGDYIETFVADGRLTIVRKVEGAAQGLLQHVKGDPSVTDQESLEDALDP